MKAGTLNGSKLQIGCLFAVLDLGLPVRRDGELIVSVKRSFGPVLRARHARTLDGKENRQQDEKKLTVGTKHHTLSSRAMPYPNTAGNDSAISLSPYPPIRNKSHIPAPYPTIINALSGSMSMNRFSAR